MSFLAPFWLPTWGQLGAQAGFKIEKMRSKHYSVAHPKRFEVRPCFSTPSWAVLAPFWPPTWRHFGPSWLRFGPSWLRFGPSWLCLGSVLASEPGFGSVLGRLVFVVLGKFFSQFAKRIQELAEDKAENKLRTDSHKNHQTTKFKFSKLRPTANLRAQMGGGIPRRGLQLNINDYPSVTLTRI